jgi:DMSO/TMAO reductase YedYZ molybdopterin-dependent catalytic subunit
MVRRAGTTLTGLLHRRLPAPPERLRVGPFRADAFTSPLRSERLTSQLGIALGTTFTICFVTGILSHGIQHPPSWFAWPSRPADLYRVTQGVHVATGIVAVPLLLAKLWSVYPRLFEWPPARDLAHALSRASVLVLVAGGLFELTTGILNIARWYAAMPFFFTTAHHWVAWITVGALVVHIGVKLPIVVRALRRGSVAVDASRRGLLAAVTATAGVLTLATVGQTLRPLTRIAVLAPRHPDIGPQGLPVNRSAVQAKVTDLARDPAYRLRIDGPRPATLTRARLAALPQHTVELPISCVEGWSATGHWTGVRVRDLLALVGAPPGARLRAESLETGTSYTHAVLPASHCRDPLTLLALRLNGAPLDLDHGYPCRIIAPNLPGVMQTKWVGRLVVLP